MNLQLTSAPAAEPLTRLEAKEQLNVTITDDDAYIDALIMAARYAVEHATGRALITQTWKGRLDAFPCARTIRLPKPPLQSVDSVQYIDGQGATQTLSTSVYDVDIHSEPARIRLKEGETWPTTKDTANAVTITFTVGHGDQSEIPEDIKTAIRFLVGHWYENRSPVEVRPGAQLINVPLTLDLLLAQRMVFE